MSTRCQIEFRAGSQRRTVYRHWDGYPKAVLPDLRAFLQWSVRGSDVEYVSANFLFWSKRDFGENYEQFGFGICTNDALHGDIEYYYVVDLVTRQITVFAADWSDGEIKLTPNTVRGAA